VEASAGFLETLRFVEGDGDEPLASSRPHHVGAKPDPLITDHSVFWGLGNTPFDREGAYRRALEHPLEPHRREQIRAAVLRGLPIGGEPFLRAAAALTGRRTTLPARGRPRRRPP
jgi:putative transposase